MCNICERIIGSTEQHTFSEIPVYVGGNKYETQIGSCEMSIQYWNQKDWDNKPPFTLSLDFNLGPDDGLAEVESEHTEIHYCPICGQKLSDLLLLQDDPLPGDFLSYLYANYGLSTRARNSLARADLTSYSDISNFIRTGKNTNEWSKFSNHNKYGIRNFGEKCYKELVLIFNEFENNYKNKEKLDDQ